MPSVVTNNDWQWAWGRPQAWGRPLDQLKTVYDDPTAFGLLKPNSPVRSLVIKPVWGSDHNRLEAVRRDNRQWLSPWEATLPPGATEPLPSLSEFRRRSQRMMRHSESLLMAIETEGKIIGSVSIGAIQHGAMSLGNLGYWIAEDWSRLGITSLSVATVIDMVIGELGLHRLEINVRPENQASLGLCHRLGLRDEGLRVRYMCIAGRWSDHVSFAVDQEMLRSGGLVETRIRRQV